LGDFISSIEERQDKIELRGEGAAIESKSILSYKKQQYGEWFEDISK
jgi:hypothetical protein